MSSQPRQIATFLMILAAPVALSHCVGCSAECNGQRAGGPGCPCSVDQDCSAQAGSLLICARGTCEEGDPQDFNGDPDTDCGDDADCPAGQACGGNGFCAPVADCQRLSPRVAYVFVGEAGAPAAASLTVSDCEHTFTLGSNSVRVARIGIDGKMIFATDEQDCDQGDWFAAFRLGRIVCGGATFAVAVDVEGVTPCVGSACTGCDQPAQGSGGENVGVCR